MRKNMPLTDSQKKAVRTKDTNVLVSAGAGTGKTTVLVERFLHLVTSGAASVTEILSVTFTEKAANEMKSRIMQSLHAVGMEQARLDLESAYISTIHAFSARILREHPIEAGVDPEFRVIEAEEADFLKIQAVDKAMEAGCEKDRGIFELIRVYGENRIHNGIVKVFNAARGEGKTLSQFFKSRPSDSEKISARRLFEESGENDLAEDWRRFEKGEWDWKVVEEFRNWSKNFGRRGGQKQKEIWKEIAQICRNFLGHKIEVFAKPWMERFEMLALIFEEIYETEKKEKGFLDFDDLQLKAVQLFKREGKPYEKLRKRYQERFKQILLDEFQDTNFLQLELIELLSSGNNLFFVGDFKQSIYGFRGAEPALFLQKEKAYQEKEKGVRIPLCDNFRTGEVPLRFVNRFFEILWAEDEIPLEALVPCTQREKQAQPELLLVESGEGESMDQGRFKEAEMIAEKVLDLHSEGIPYGDMAILFQAVKEIGIYEQALKKRGISYSALSVRGFYYQPEIRDTISYLSFLENPLADIPLAAVLRSPLFQVRDNTLFWLSDKAKADDLPGEIPTPLYQGIKRFEDMHQMAEDEKEKLRFFVKVSEELLGVRDHLRLSELVDRILERTGYELKVLADPNGVRKFANLKKMIALARKFERNEPLTLSAFLRKIRRLEVQEVRESEAQIESEESGRVLRLMSIHQAKGLEFPVVFVADLGRSRQTAESKTVISEMGYGYSISVRNEDTLEMEVPLSWQSMNSRLNQKEKEEWKRLFYVALTRAKDRLILSGICREKKNRKENFYEMSSWMDWILAVEPQIPGNLKIRRHSEVPIRKRKLGVAERKGFRETFGDFKPVSPEKLFPKPSSRDRLYKASQALLVSVEEKPFDPIRVIDLPVSAYAAFRKSPEHYRKVYEIGYSGEGASETDQWTQDPEPVVSAADFGQAMHKFFERMDFQSDVPVTEDLFQECFQMGTGPSDLSPRADEGRRMLEEFYQTSLFRELRNAKVIHREIPFLLNERHGLIQGVLDVLFQDQKGKWHILDYKTGEGQTEKVKKEGTELQIQLYAHALYQITGIVPVSGILHFLRNNWTYRLVFNQESIQRIERQVKGIQEEILSKP